MKILIEIQAVINSEKLPDWNKLSDAVMSNMSQLYPLGIVAQSCDVSAELSTEEEETFNQ